MKLAHIQTFDSWRSSSSFRFLFLGNICSNGAQWLQLFTAGWLVQTLSADLATTGLLVALVGGINLLPSLLIGPIGGVLGDRLNRKYLIMSLQGFMACVAWFFAFWNTTDYVEVWHVIAYVVNFRLLFVHHTANPQCINCYYSATRINWERNGN